MVLVLGLNTKARFFTLDNCRCEGVGWDSGCEHEGSHLMHDIDISYNIA